MQASYSKLADKGFVVLAINELEDDAKVREHIRQFGHTFPVLMDRDNKVATSSACTDFRSASLSMKEE